MSRRALVNVSYSCFCSSIRNVSLPPSLTIFNFPERVDSEPENSTGGYKKSYQGLVCRMKASRRIRCLARNELKRLSLKAQWE